MGVIYKNGKRKVVYVSDIHWENVIENIVIAHSFRFIQVCSMKSGEKGFVTIILRPLAMGCSKLRYAIDNIVFIKVSYETGKSMTKIKLCNFMLVDFSGLNIKVDTILWHFKQKHLFMFVSIWLCISNKNDLQTRSYFYWPLYVPIQHDSLDLYFYLYFALYVVSGEEKDIKLLQRTGII